MKAEGTLALLQAYRTILAATEGKIASDLANILSVWVRQVWLTNAVYLGKSGRDVGDLIIDEEDVAGAVTAAEFCISSCFDCLPKPTQESLVEELASIVSVAARFIPNDKVDKPPFP